MTQSIELAHEPAFRLGELEIFPSTHEIRHGGHREIIEPRVMQVLIALAQADGAVLTRDELVFACWGGRIVGDDAIHRVLSRLRRLTDGIARDEFRIETITKVGYRLVRPTDEAPSLPALGAQLDPASSATPLGRRSLVVGAGAIAVVGAAGLWLSADQGKEDLPPEAEALMAKGRAAMRLGTPEHVASAVSLFRKATQAAPASAQPWGALAFAYQVQLLGTQAAKRLQVEARARSAADRALAIDSGNVEALIVVATLRPYFGRWSEFDSGFRQILARHPENWIINKFYGAFLGDVGRPRAALRFLDRAMAIDPVSPPLQSMRAHTNWAAGRLDEADAAINAAAELWPRHFAVWFVRNRILAYTGRTTMALAMIADTDSRPIGIPDWNFELCRLEAVALETRKPSDIDAGIAAHLDAAHKGVGFAEIAIMFAAAVGRLDDAFAVLMAYYFNRGFEMSDRRYSNEQGRFSSQRQRNTFFLFLPLTAALQTDPRFDALVKEIGLEDYWRKSGTLPDYRRN